MKLIEVAKNCSINNSNNIVHFIDDTEGNKLLNDLEHYSHLYVLACIMDKQIKAERAWQIPIKIGKIIGGYDFSIFTKLSMQDCIQIFNKYKLHRFNDDQAKYFYLAIQKIKNDYNSIAANIWNDNPKSATLVLRFLDFEGVGIKIATMAANILVRQYKIQVLDKYSIDISPDVHVKKIFYRMGLIKNRENIDEVIYKARELYPEFPGIIDFSTWEIGRNYCFETNPNCAECPISEDCKKIIN